jgi:hypothetical protein
MYARLTTVQLQPDKAQEAIDLYPLMTAPPVREVYEVAVQG